jgi:protein disulfide-isomerase A6
MQHDGVVFVEFFAPWCGHCKQLAPAWIEAAKALKGVVKIAAVDADQHQALGQPYGVKGFPTIKIFGADKSKPKDYQQARDAPAIAQAAIQEVSNLVQQRLGGGGGGPSGPSAVVTLTDENFDKEVMQSTDLWLVQFYAPWCGHCKQLAPEWEGAASDLEGKFKMGKLDATTEKSTGQKYKVEGFPTIKFFGGDKTAPEDYNGGRTKSDLVTFGMDKVEASLPPPEVHELNGQQVWNDNCDGKSICLIAFVPALFETQASGRNSFIDLLKALTEKQILKKFGFMWTSAGQQPALESKFQIGDYPALVAVNPKKSIYAKMRGSFSKDELSGFVGRLLKSRESVSPFEAPEALEAYEPWDGGEEVVAEEEEEFSLDDLMNEELEN